MKTIDVVRAYNTLKDAKLNKLSGKEKMQVIRVIVALKPVVERYNEIVAIASEKMKDEQFGAIVDLARQWQLEGENTSLTPEERANINHYFAKYESSVEEAVREDAEKEAGVEFERVDAGCFERLLDSNPDWGVGVIVALQGMIAKQ